MCRWRRGGGKVSEEHPDVALLLFQVVQRRVESNGVLCGSVRMVCELVWFEVWREMVHDVLKN